MRTLTERPFLCGVKPPYYIKIQMSIRKCVIDSERMCECVHGHDKKRNRLWVYVDVDACVCVFLFLRLCLRVCEGGDRRQESRLAEGGRPSR